MRYYNVKRVVGSEKTPHNLFFMADYDSHKYLRPNPPPMLTHVTIKLKEVEVEPEPFNYKTYLIGFIIGCGIIVWAVN